MTSLYRHDTKPRRGGAAGSVRLVLLLVGSLLAAACASTPSRPTAYSPDELIAAANARARPSVADEIVVPFRVSDELVDQARELVRYSRSDWEKAKELSAAITAEEGFGLEYEPVATAPAAETVARGHGNCMSLISVFIGLARELGLTAYYIDASDRISDLRREESLIVDSGHIAAVARTERGWTMVDYDGHVEEYRTFKIIDDVTALAHYYNNLGYELIDRAVRRTEPIPWPTVQRNFELATLVRPGFARAHNNLGVAYTKMEQLVDAEEAYRVAIEADPRLASAHHNLGNLLYDRDEFEEAVTVYDRALALQKGNPYLHNHRGMALYRARRHVEAIDAFRQAIRYKRDYIEAYNLLAQTYSSLGRHDEAEEVRSRARALRTVSGR